MKSNAISGFVVVLFGLFFLLPGLLLSGWYFHGYTRWIDAMRWDEVPCRIESAELKSSRGSKSTTYRVEAVYHYQYKGKPYRSDRVDFSTGSDNVGDHHRRVYREISAHIAGPPENGVAESRSPGPMFRCYVNPDNPEDAVLYRDLRWEMQAFLAVFALTFPAVGAGVVAGGIVSARSRRREDALRNQFPGEPWRWRSDWAGAAITESSGKWRMALYAYTLWSGAVILPLIAAAIAGGAFTHSAAAWLLLIFPAIWLIPAMLSVRKMRQRAAIGNARLELKSHPVPPGGTLAGEIALGKMVRALSGAEISLACERKTTVRQGNKSSVSTDTVWSCDEAVGAEMIAGDVAGTRIPVRVAIPRDVPVTGPEENRGDSEIGWKLRLKIPGTAVDAGFDIPVFVDPNAPAISSTPAAEATTIAAASLEDLPDLLARQRLVLETDGRGLPVTLRCPPLRQLGMLAFLLVFNLIWTTVAVVLWVQDAPWMFKLIWPLSAAGLWVLIVWNALLSRTLTLDDTGLRLLNRLGPAQWQLELARDQITGFACDSNMQSNNRSIYRVRAESVFGRKHTLVGGISHLPTAEALTAALERWRKGG